MPTDAAALEAWLQPAQPGIGGGYPVLRLEKETADIKHPPILARGHAPGRRRRGDAMPRSPSSSQASRSGRSRRAPDSAGTASETTSPARQRARLDPDAEVDAVGQRGAVPGDVHHDRADREAGREPQQLHEGEGPAEQVGAHAQTGQEQPRRHGGAGTEAEQRGRRRAPAPVPPVAESPSRSAQPAARARRPTFTSTGR